MFNPVDLQDRSARFSWCSRRWGALILACCCGVLLTGCDRNVVYKRSIGDLNAKAQALLQQGDVAGAECRLVSAMDLDPNEPVTLQNLARVYYEREQYPEALSLFEKLATIEAVKDKHVILASMAIIYENQADKLRADVTDWEMNHGKQPEDSPADAAPAATLAQAKTSREKALNLYEKSIQTYQQAIAQRHPESAQLSKRIEQIQQEHDKLSQLSLS